MKRSLTLLAVLALMLALYVPMASAGMQAAGSQPAAQDPKKEENDAYKAWYDANQAKDYAKAFALARTYTEKYPSGQYADYLKKWIPPIRFYLFNQAIQAKNVPEMMKLGEEGLAQDPAKELDYSYLMAVQLRQNEISATPQNLSHAALAADMATRAIRLIEAGKMPSFLKPDQWKAGVTLGYLYQTLAIIEAAVNKNNDKALEYYVKASQADPTDPTNFYSCGALHMTKYSAASEKLEKFPKEDLTDPPTKPEVKAVWDDVNKEADAVIDCWAHFMALTQNIPTWNTARSKVEPTLSTLYNFRNPNKPDGLKQLIEQIRTGQPATPPATTAPAAGTATTKP